MWLTPGPRLGASWQIDFRPLGAHGRRSYSRILSKSWRRLIPRRSAVLVRLPPQASKARWIARRSTSASRAAAGAARQGRRPRGVTGRRIVDVEVFGQDGPAPRGDRRPGQGVLQLADVARPGPLADRREGLGEKRSSPQPCRRSSASQDVLGQRRDVLGAVAERRDDDPGDVEAVEQVLAEPAGGDLLRQVAVGGRDDAGVGAEGLGPADALELALLEDAEDLGLGRQRQLADLVEEDGAAGGCARTGRASGGRRR